MKSSSLILSVIFIMIILSPCIGGGVCHDHLIEDTHDHDTHASCHHSDNDNSDDEDLPHCHCMCTSISIITPDKVNILNSFLVDKSSIQVDYLNHYLFSFSETIWHPPLAS